MGMIQILFVSVGSLHVLIKFIHRLALYAFMYEYFCELRWIFTSMDLQW
jgi:hypothetical protein